MQINFRNLVVASFFLLFWSCKGTYPLSLKKGEISVDAEKEETLEAYVVRFYQKKRTALFRTDHWDVRELRLYLEKLPLEGGKVDIVKSGSYGRYREGGQVLVYDSRVCTGELLFDLNEQGENHFSGSMNLTFHSPITNRTKRASRTIKGDFVLKKSR